MVSTNLRSVLILLWALLLVATMPLANAQAQEQGHFNSGLLVTPTWLMGNAERPHLRIIDFGREIGDYDEGHIPSARFLDKASITAEVGGVPGMLAHVERVAQVLREIGVDDESTVVIYDDVGGLWASRLFWAMEYLGHRDVRLLDGGWSNWVAEGGEASNEEPAFHEGNFTPVVRPCVFATADWIFAHLDVSEVQIIDTRTLPEYTGEDARADRGGHIPGAVNFDWVLSIAEDAPRTFLPPEQLRNVYEFAGITAGAEIVTYCQGGVRAAHTYFVLRLLGYPRIRMYDASWAEWGNDPEVPIATGVPHE